MLSGTGFGDDSLGAEAPGKQRLPNRIIDLMRTGMRQVLTL